MAMEPVNTHAHACQNFTSKRRGLIAPLNQQVKQNKIVCSTHIDKVGKGMAPILQDTNGKTLQ